MKNLSRKNIILTAVALVVVLVILLSAVTKGNDPVILESEEQRISYINSIGITVTDDPPAVRNIIIPADFPPVYKKYNELQKQYGFDLWNYRGEPAVQYTYKVTDYRNDKGEAEQDVRINLITYEGHLIGGDISSTRLDGFMKGLG